MPQPPIFAHTEKGDSIEELESKMAYMGLCLGELTVQEEKFVLLISSGMTVATAGRAVGLESSSKAHSMRARASVDKAVEYYRQEMREKVNFNVDNAHLMYMEAFGSSANATEMIKATDSLVKLHSLVALESGPSITLHLNNEKQLDQLSDEDLLAIVGKDTNYLKPVRAIEHEQED